MAFLAEVSVCNDLVQYVVGLETPSETGVVFCLLTVCVSGMRRRGPGGVCTTMDMSPDIWDV